MNKRDAEVLIEQIRCITLGKPIEIQLQSEENTELQEAMSCLAESVSEINYFLRELSKGNLEVTPPSRYDFVDSFNAMVKQLAEREKKLIEKQEYIERIAHRDELTELYNRRYCIQKLDSLLIEKKKFVFCMIDMDGLKQVNDMFGHLQGDWYLVKVSEEIKNIVTENDKACRLGGDEFAIIFEDKCKSEIDIVMKQINMKLSAAENKHPMSISYGIIFVDTTNDIYDIEKVFGEADKIMYECKRKKKELERMD